MPLKMYTKDGCVQCKATYRVLDKEEVEYLLVNVSQDESAADNLRERGLTQMPVLESHLGTWTGHRPDKLAEYIADVKPNPES